MASAFYGRVIRGSCLLLVGGVGLLTGCGAGGYGDDGRLFVDPGRVVVAPGQTQRFTVGATESRTYEQQWSLREGSAAGQLQPVVDEQGQAQTYSIDYTAPTSAGTYRINVSAQVGSRRKTKQASATIEVVPPSS